jgi:hypothetical protein
MKIAIVGADGTNKAWTPERIRKAKSFIRNLLTDIGLTIVGGKTAELVVVSGHCPQGGVDIWAEEIADELEIQKEIYPPNCTLAFVGTDENGKETSPENAVDVRPRSYEECKEWFKKEQMSTDNHFWLYHFRPRNIKIAEACDILYDIEPKGSCRHCRGKGFKRDRFIGGLYDCEHCQGAGVYSGGTWTLRYAKSLGKEVHQVIIE